MPEHSPEPWECRDQPKELYSFKIIHHEVPGTYESIAELHSKRNADRIIACVNALAGIPDDVIPSVKALLDSLLKAPVTVDGAFPYAPMLECFLNYNAGD